MAHKTFILHDDSVNTYGFRMLTSGGNIGEFERNPVMFFQHNDYTLPIGRWENIRKEGSQILADAVFDEEDEDALKIKGKVDRNFIRMASIGTWAPEETSDDPTLKLPGQTGPTITKWTLREASIVSIGANHNALRMYDRETGELINLSDSKSVLQFIDSITKKTTKMINLREILNLSDSATDNDVEAAVQSLKQENDRLQQQNTTLVQENKQLKDDRAAQDEKRLQDQKAEAITLVDTAIRDGRLDASGKDAFLALFDSDFEKAKTTLTAIPRVKRISEQMEPAAVELSDLAKKSWSELDRAGLLPMLKDKAYDIYAEKFKAEFGHEPK